MSRQRELLKRHGTFETSLKMQTSDSSDREAVSLSPNAEVPKLGPGSLGCTFELCAGIVDKGISLVQIAQEEVLEETGDCRGGLRVFVPPAPQLKQALYSMVT